MVIQYSVCFAFLTSTLPQHTHLDATCVRAAPMEVWDESKENVMPVRGGRRVKGLGLAAAAAPAACKDALKERRGADARQAHVWRKPRESEEGGPAGRVAWKEADGE